MPPLNGHKSKDIRERLINLMIIFDRLSRDFPQSSYDDIRLGRFEHRLLTYQRMRKAGRVLGPDDFGEVTDDMDFEQLVEIYETILEKEEPKRRIEIPLDTDHRI